MNILMLTDVYFPRVNGVSTSIQTGCRELVRMGHSVTIVAPDYGEPEASGEFEIVRLPARRIFFDPEDRLIKRGAIAGIVAQLAARSWDVIHVHTPFRAHQIGMRLALRSGVATVESYHTYFEEYVANYLPWLPRRIGRFAVRRFSRTLCEDVDHLIVPTVEMAEVLRGYGIDTPATVIPTGIPLEQFAGGDGARLRARHGIDRAQPMILTVGRLAIEKNIDFLLEVARRLAPEFSGLVFVVAGEGPDAPRLRARVAALGLEDTVRFLGNLDRHTELLDCYAAADVFVFASSTETQGLVLIEAMAVGTPIVSTAVMGTATVLKGARSARIAEENIDAFAAEVAALLRSPAARAELKAAGPRDADRWSAASLMQDTVELYERLAENARARRHAMPATSRRRDRYGEVSSG